MTLYVVFRTATSEVDTPTYNVIGDIHLYDVVQMKEQPMTYTSFIPTAPAEETQSPPTRESVAEPKVGGADETGDYKVIASIPPTNVEEESINVTQCPAYGLAAKAKVGGGDESITSQVYGL